MSPDTVDLSSSSSFALLVDFSINLPNVSITGAVLSKILVNLFASLSISLSPNGILRLVLEALKMMSLQLSRYSLHFANFKNFDGSTLI